MAILIKDMNMPTECEYCPLCRYYPESKRVWCHGTNRILKNVWENADWTHLGVKKPDWCPLVEVPKGARLIDARDVKKHMIPLDFSVQNWISEVDLDIKVPTIFEEGKQ